MCRRVIELYRINHLMRRHIDVNDAKVFRESVSNEAAAEIRQHSQFLVRCLVRHKCFACAGRIKIICMDA